MVRWMPPPGQDISWDWIKEALPSLNQQETLYMIVCDMIIITSTAQNWLNMCPLLESANLFLSQFS